jgi:hypothetical protein
MLKFTQMKWLKIYAIWLACLGLAACSFNPFAALKSPSMPNPMTVPLSQLTSQLESLWGQLDQSEPSSSDSGPILWQPAYSPLFPTEWPPTPTTQWRRYAYAQGQDMSLADGVHVAKPWAQVEMSGDRATALITPLSAQLDPFAIQGVAPLEAETLAVLKQEDQVSTYALRLKNLPDPNTSEITAMRAFYQTWLNYNGTIAGEIKPNHTAFFKWLTAR